MNHVWLPILMIGSAPDCRHYAYLSNKSDKSQINHYLCEQHDKQIADTQHNITFYVTELNFWSVFNQEDVIFLH